MFSLHGIIVVQIETNCLADLSNQLMSYMYLHGDNSDRDVLDRYLLPFLYSINVTLFLGGRIS